MDKSEPTCYNEVSFRPTVFPTNHPEEWDEGSELVGKWVETNNIDFIHTGYSFVDDNDGKKYNGITLNAKDTQRFVDFLNENNFLYQIS